MGRALLLAALLFVLTACGGADQRAPFTDSRIPPALGPRFWAPEGWAWGLIGVGDAPVQRYGVSSTTMTPKASILILSGYGESAEAWFETARELNLRGYNVWVLERSGQGGSERYVMPRDLGHAPDFDDDIAVTRAVARMIVESAPQTPLVALGQAEGGLIALAAAQKGLPIDGVILSAPTLTAPAGPADWRGWATRIGLGRLPDAFDYGWKRDGPDAFASGLTSDRRRGEVIKAWQLANPDLRMGGKSLGWSAAFRTTATAAGDGLSRVRAPALMVIAGGGKQRTDLERTCKAMPQCTALPLAGAGLALHLETDSVRIPWLTAVGAFARERAAARDAGQQTPLDHRL